MKKIILFCCLAAFVFSWGGVYKQSQKFESQNVSLRYSKENGISALDINKIAAAIEKNKDKDIPQIMLWNEQNSTVKTKHNNKSEATIVSMTGANLFPTQIKCGTQLSMHDASGCTIDEQLAYSLFGTVDVLNKTVIANEKPYVIRGVINHQKPIININKNVLADKKSEGEKFLSAEFLFENTKNGRDDAARFIAKYNLPSPEIIIDGSNLALLSRFLVLIPSIIMLIVVFFKLICRTFKLSNHTVLFLMSLAFTIIVVALGIFILDIPLTLPNRFIPSRWSDFSFWSNQIKSFATHANELFARTQNIMDAQLIRNGVELLLLFFAAIFTLVLTLERINATTPKQLLWLSMLCLMLTGGFALINDAALPRFIWLAVPYYMVILTLVNMNKTESENVNKSR